MIDLSPEEKFRRLGGRTQLNGAAHKNAQEKGGELPAFTENPSRPLIFVDPVALQGRPVDPRQWIVDDWLPVGSATLNYGDGGTGKSLLAQQLMTSTATGKPWIGLAVTPCKSLAVFCEDDEAELHRRQNRINAAYGVEFTDLGAMTWSSGVGRDNSLMRFAADGRPVRTEMFDEIRKAARNHEARLVVIDTAADTFGGNENDRAQVRNFMGAMNGLAMDIDGAVLVNAHPSRTGLSATGDVDGGSTAWSNTARSRWSLARPKAEGEAQPDTDERLLTRRKANYAAIGTQARLQWHNGVLVPLGRPAGIAAAAAMADADAVFIELLAKADDGNLPVSASCNAHNFAPKIFAGRPDRQGFSRRDFEAALQRLMATSKITLVNYGRKGDERRRIALQREEQSV